MARARTPGGLSDFYPGTGVVVGAAVGVLASVIVGGGWVSVLGIVIGAGVGLVVGSALSVRQGGRTP